MTAFLVLPWSFPGGSDNKESAFNVGDLDSIPESGRFPREGNGYQLQSVFLPGEFHGQRSLASYSPCNPKELRVEVGRVFRMGNTCIPMADSC